MKTKFALGIEVEILFARNEQKDCNVKPDPQGNAQIPIKWSKNGWKGNKIDGFRERTIFIKTLYGYTCHF